MFPLPLLRPLQLTLSLLGGAPIPCFEAHAIPLQFAVWFLTFLLVLPAGSSLPPHPCSPSWCGQRLCVGCRLSGCSLCQSPFPRPRIHSVLISRLLLGKSGNFYLSIQMSSPPMVFQPPLWSMTFHLFLDLQYLPKPEAWTQTSLPPPRPSSSRWRRQG